MAQHITATLVHYTECCHGLWSSLRLSFLIYKLGGDWMDGLRVPPLWILLAVLSYVEVPCRAREPECAGHRGGPQVILKHVTDKPLPKMVSVITFITDATSLETRCSERGAGPKNNPARGNLTPKHPKVTFSEPNVPCGLEALMHNHASESESHRKEKTSYEFPFLPEHLSGRKWHRSQSREVFRKQVSVVQTLRKKTCT